MASIKDLQNNQEETVIDATQPPKDTPKSSNKQLEVTNGRGKTVVNMNGMFEAQKGNHTSITPKGSSQSRAQRVTRDNSGDINIDATGGGRKAVDLSSFPSQTAEEEAYDREHYIDDPMKKMLEGEDSLVGKYLAKKEVELTDAYEEVSYNQEVQKLEEEAELTGDDSELIDFMNKHEDERVKSNEDNEESTVSSNNKVIINDDDILSSLNTNNEEEETEMSDEEKKVKDVLEEEFDDSELDDQELYPEDEGYPENDEDDGIPVEEDEEEDPDPEEVEESLDEAFKDKKEEKKEEKVKVENPDIDLEVTSVENSGTNSIIDNIDMSLEDIEEEDTPEPDDDTNEVLQKLQKLATERLKPVSKRLDISSFTVIKKPVSNTKQFNVNPVKAAKWVLMNQEATVIMREFTGAELEKLREFTQDGNSASSLTKRYRMIYDHIDSPKPASFETWLKTTPFSDEDNYFFAIYIASFKGANYLPRDCSDQNECKETWLTEDINIMDMVKFDTEEAKKKFTTIYQEEDSSTTKAGLYVSERVALSDTVAISFREPSIYTRIELSTIDQEFREKYSSIMEYIPYIDSIYFINQEKGTLTPVGYKLFADNNIKTTKSKIQQFAKVLSTLSIDEFGTIRPYVNSVATRTTGMTYRYPECTCPKCGKIVEEATASAEELLFTRYQLGALVNTSLN